MIGRIKINLIPHWKDIRYEFLQSSIVDAIECTSVCENEKCFNVLKAWIEIDLDACYCKVLRALQTYQFNNTVEDVKKLIMESKLEKH